MKFTYCSDCGSLLSARSLGDEGMVPWCEKCGKPWFDMFPVAIIALVHDGEGNVLLLRQNYISTQYHNLVSGYVTPGETAEKTAVREIFEETGQKVSDLKLVCTNWYERKQMLMVGFFARVERLPLNLSCEVDSACWVPASEVPSLVHPTPSSTSRLLSLEFLKRHGVATKQG